MNCSIQHLYSITAKSASRHDGRLMHSRDCVRLASQADSPELREKLLNPGPRMDARGYA